jgi:3-oxoacyl-[acyl-carrier protein] reductase
MNKGTPTEYAGKIALVTGAARGIGLAIARSFCQAGAHAVVADIEEERGKTAVEILRRGGGKADFISVDLARPGASARMVQETAELCGGLDILINNARAGRRLPLLQESEENWDLALNVGLRAAFFATQASLPHMTKRGGGSVINIASVAAQLVTNEAASYHASKAGLLHLTRYLAVFAGPHRVRVNAVLPGLVIQDEHRERFESEANSDYRRLAFCYQPLGLAGSENDICEAVLYLCSSRAGYVSGACLTLDGAATVQEPFGLLIKEQSQPVDQSA